MNNKCFATKTLSLLVACGAVAVCGNSAMALTPVGPAADPGPKTDYTHFGANIALQCTLETPSDSIQATATDYTETTSPTFDDYIAPNDTGTTPSVTTSRVTALEATETSTFNCNSDTVNLDLQLDTLTSPVFTNATNFNLGVGVDHNVTVVLSNGTTVGPAVANTTGAVAGVGGTGTATDTQGNLNVAITSQFAIKSGTNAAEELGEGDYETVFIISVTAE
jgi:hypothetical protein